jgi:alkylation response protein AidB-like acyl-CoA dehydrogenase
MEQVNLSRLSHGVRAAAMMRRGVNEAMVCARGRVAFGKAIIEYPLLRRQLLKITVPTEQALSMFLFAADSMDRANAGSKQAESVLRILTPLLKFRACRDNIPVATGSMEVRGGNGECATGPRCPYRRALGRHQQHQRARYPHPRGRQEPCPPDAGNRAQEIAG